MVSSQLADKEIVPLPAFNLKDHLYLKGLPLARKAGSGIVPLGRSFYERNTQVVAFELIGKVLIFKQGDNFFIRWFPVSWRAIK